MPNQAKAKWDGVINPQNDSFSQFLSRKILMLSKHYECTEADRRTWLHVPSGTPFSTSSDIYQVVKTLKETLLRCIHQFESDLTNNMDHMRISGTLTVAIQS